MTSFNIQELLRRKSKRHGTKTMHPSLSRAFQRHQEHNLKHPGSVALITTKQNKQPSFIDRWQGHNVTHSFVFICFGLNQGLDLPYRGMFDLLLGVPWSLFLCTLHPSTSFFVTLWHPS